MTTSTTEAKTFKDLGLSDQLVEAVNKMGYTEPTPIQANIIPYVLQKRDVLGQAQTGTGKTAAFALPLLNNMDLDTKIVSPQVLVLAPTRELAIQVSEAFESFAKNIARINVMAIYGGQEYGKQIQALRRGVHVVVGTAGRVMDHMRKGTLKLDNLKALVLDEADEMLRMGFIDDVRWVLTHTPDTCQRLLFSATMPRDVINIVNDYLRDPCKVQIKNKTATAPTITQRYMVIRGFNKNEALDRILEIEETDGVMIFVKTKSSTIDVADALKSYGYKASAINGDMQQNQREQIIDQLKKSKINILVATDVVARGLDVERISHVINYDIPSDNDSYVHRIGRTGRAGRSGQAISLVYTKDMRFLRQLEKMTRSNMEEMNLPSANDITVKKVTKFKHDLAEIIRHKDLAKFHTVIDEVVTEYDMEVKDIAAGLAFMCQKDQPIFVKELKVRPVRESSFERRDSGRSFDNNRGRNSDRPSGDRQRSSGNRGNEDMQTYRIEVGRADGIEPRNIVGAIANEAGLSSRKIGQIRLFDDYSTVDLPKDMSKDSIDHLKKVWVSGKKMNIKPA